MPRVNKSEQNKQVMIGYLLKFRGHVGKACKKTGIGRTIFYRWLKEDPKFKAAIEEQQELELDDIEDKLLSKAKDGDVSAMRIYLMAKGKKRGYSNKVTVSGDPDQPLIPKKHVVRVQFIDCSGKKK